MIGAHRSPRAPTVLCVAVGLVAASLNHTAREVSTTLGVALFGGLFAGIYSDQMHRVTA
ncbi:hypothetical protein [Conexibacter sp. DBS9H8]|uniref:hypothetical protein n=1 Tax=Conexibacter sp. DBS9H8 TaxID=2937801 RepID=UPI00200D70DF|nr:hypothetical protein [Conexibacter sp. DBS9H8]